MAYSVSGGEPSVGDVLGSAFADALALSKKNMMPALILIVLGTVVGLALAMTGGGKEQMVQGPIAACEIVIVVMSYYAIAAAVRTLNPSYRMTAGQFFGFLGYSIVAGLLTTLASFFFVIPAFWIGPKVLLTPYTYVITNGAPGALPKTWNMTTGYYWPTLGFIILLAITVGIIAGVASGIATAVILAAPVASIIALPLVLAVLVWLLHVQALAYVRWTASLLPRVEPAVPVTA
jgi:hypothetical protein